MANDFDADFAQPYDDSTNNGYYNGIWKDARRLVDVESIKNSYEIPSTFPWLKQKNDIQI